MRVRKIDDDLYLAIGESYRSNSTIFISGSEAVLVDGTGSRPDAEDLRRLVEKELGKEVRFILSTHFFSDHMAALQYFPNATVIAHENYKNTFDSEMYRTEEEKSFFKEPDILMGDGLTIRWGRFTLGVSHTPGHTPSTLSVDIPEADLLIVGDNLVGNIVYLNYSTPELFSAALARLQAKARGRLLSGHGDIRSPEAIVNAGFYLESLRERTLELRQAAREQTLVDLPLEDFLPPCVEGTSVENIFHARNLRTILDRNFFLPAV